MFVIASVFVAVLAYTAAWLSPRQPAVLAQEAPLPACQVGPNAGPGARLRLFATRWVCGADHHAITAVNAELMHAWRWI